VSLYEVPDGDGDDDDDDDDDEFNEEEITPQLHIDLPVQFN
jgi:hypothetical protein